jgi:hypothetical protein
LKIHTVVVVSVVSVVLVVVDQLTVDVVVVVVVDMVAHLHLQCLIEESVAEVQVLLEAVVVLIRTHQCTIRL